MTDVIQVTKRDSTGTSATRRLRSQGYVPAVLYGHGEGNEHLAVPSKQVEGLLRHHSKTVKLSGDVKETALISDMQWDPLGIEVLHMDLIRVNLKEKVEIEVPLHLHGEAIGAREGGVFLETVHEVLVRCSAGSIPESLTLDINDINIGEHKTAGQLELPSGIELLTPAETVVAHVEAPRIEEEELTEEEAAAAEPEVISNAAQEDDEDEA